MTAVKRMTAKSNFLKMPLKERNCKVELYEDCRRRRLLEECECIPLEATGLQVMALAFLIVCLFCILIGNLINQKSYDKY